MHQIRFRLRLRPRPRWGSSQRSPRLPSWILGVLFLRGRGGKGGEERGREGEKRGRGRGREGREKGKGEGREGKGRGRRTSGFATPGKIS